MTTVAIALFNSNGQELIPCDWSDVLNGVVTLASVVYTVPSPVTKVSEGIDIPNGLSQVKVTGGLHGVIYMIEATATLSNGEIIPRSFPARCWDK